MKRYAAFLRGVMPTNAKMPELRSAFERAGFTEVKTVLSSGNVVFTAPAQTAGAIERSAEAAMRKHLGRAFPVIVRPIDALDAAARARGLTPIGTVELDLAECELPALDAHDIWARWVYAFVPEPRRLLERATRALRRGGVMVFHEYFDYRAWRLSPRSPEFQSLVAEVMASWRATGGDTDVGLDLPRWLGELGFEIRGLTPLQDAARPGDHVWQWPRAFVGSGIRRMVALGRLTEDQGRAIEAAFATFESTPHAFQITPGVLEIIAVRK